MWTARMPSGLQVAKIEAERLDRKQVHRDRVARKRVDREDIEILRRLPSRATSRASPSTISTFAWLSIRKVNCERASWITSGLIS